MRTATATPTSIIYLDTATATPIYYWLDESYSEDWDYYSKSWHRQYGPKRTCERRDLVVHMGGAEIHRDPVKSITQARAIVKKMCPAFRAEEKRAAAAWAELTRIEKIRAARAAARKNRSEIVNRRPGSVAALQKLSHRDRFASSASSASDLEFTRQYGALADTLRGGRLFKVRLRMARLAPREVFKRVAVRPNGTLTSIYGGIDYQIDVPVSAKLDDSTDICKCDGIFVHWTREAAEKQGFPDESENLKLPRVTLRGRAWGEHREDGKVAYENFMALEVLVEIKKPEVIAA